MGDKDTCNNCRFFYPKFDGVGLCKRQFSAHSKFWSDDLGKGEILVRVTFGCVQFELPAKTEVDSL